MIYKWRWWVELIVSLLLVLWFVSYQPRGVKIMPSPSIEAIDPNMVGLSKELDELKWEIDGQLSVNQQIQHMAKEK